jgi:large repetitive protein
LTRDGLYHVPHCIGVLGCDLQKDTGWPIRCTATLLPVAHGAATLPDPGCPMKFKKVTYTPQQDFAGSDVFTYTATDGAFTSTATVLVQTFDTGLLITNTVEPAASLIAMGGRITYTLRLINYGEVAAQAVLVTDTLPNGLVYEATVTGATPNLLPNHQLGWGPIAIPAGGSVMVQYTTLLTTNLSYAGRTYTNTARYTSSNAGWNEHSVTQTSRAAPVLAFVTPVADQVLLATNDLSITLPIEVSISNYTLPVDGHWRLRVNGLDWGAVSGSQHSIELPLGTHTISAQLETLTSHPIGAPVSVNVTVQRVSKILYLPLVRK